MNDYERLTRKSPEPHVYTDDGCSCGRLIVHRREERDKQLIAIQRLQRGPRITIRREHYGSE